MPRSDMSCSERVAVDLDLVRHLRQAPPGRRAAVVLGDAPRQRHSGGRAGEVVGQICGQPCGTCESATRADVSNAISQGGTGGS